MFLCNSAMTRELFQDIGEKDSNNLSVYRNLNLHLLPSWREPVIGTYPVPSSHT